MTFFFFRRIPFRTLPFPWSPWRAGSPRRRSLPNGRRSRNLWWDWKKLRRKANPDTHTGHRPGQGSLIDARHYWVPVMIISFVVLTHGATLTNPPPPNLPLFAIECKNLELQKSGNFSNWWFWDLVTDYFGFSGTEDFFVLHCIISYFWTNFIQLLCSRRIQYFERRLFIYSLFCFWFFFCSFFVYMEKVEDIVCKREINYFGGLPFQ